MADRALDVVGGFIATAPLYQKLDLKPFENDAIESSPGLSEMTPILRYCSNERCKAERPFRRIGFQTGLSSSYGSRQADNIFTMLYRCTHCDSPFWCWIEVSEPDKWLRKVGQVPPYDISIASDLGEALGEDAVLYKRAQICMSQSFGVGACTYLRRVLENQIAPLLRLVYEARKEEGEEVSDLSRIMEERTAEKKIRLANQVLPASVAVPGDNPLELIYDRLSAGLHRQSEDECMVIAREASQVLQHVIVGINDEYQRRRSKNRYVDLIRKMRGR